MMRNFQNRHPLDMMLNGFALLIITLTSFGGCLVCYKTYGGIGGAFLMATIYLTAWYVIYFLSLLFLWNFSGIINLLIAIFISYWAICGGGPIEVDMGIPGELSWYHDHGVPLDPTESPMQQVQEIQSRILDDWERNEGLNSSFDRGAFYRACDHGAIWFAHHEYRNKTDADGHWPVWSQSDPNDPGTKLAEKMWLDDYIAKTDKADLDLNELKDQVRYFREHKDELTQKFGPLSDSTSIQWKVTWEHDWDVRVAANDPSTIPFKNGNPNRDDHREKIEVETELSQMGYYN